MKQLIIIILTAAAIILTGMEINVLDGREKLTEWSVVINEILRNAPEGAILYFPRGEYNFDNPIDITRGVTLRLERGAKLMTDRNCLIQIISGSEIIIEGIGGHGELINSRQSNNIISLDNIAVGAHTSLRLRNIALKGFTGISDARSQEKAPMGDLEISDCRFECSDTCIIRRYGEVASLKIENSVFEGGARIGAYVGGPMPGGATVRGNIFRDIGSTALQLSGGNFSQVADGSMDFLPNAIVENNQILGGGQQAPLTRSYIHGILVYGHNVIVRGNIVRDFNRGEKVPDAPYGHQFKLPDGTYFRGIRIATDNDPSKRLAGSAIYLKAHRAIVANNICTNSGWRSVIEVKTGRIGPYVLVTGNIVDGSSLSIEGSFGFECSANNSVWSNNLVYNIPNHAFAVRAHLNNTYLNNVIHNAKIGFYIDGGNQECFLNNRFINVNKQYENAAPMNRNPVSASPPLFVSSVDQLPMASTETHGQIAIVSGHDGDRVMVCLTHGDEYAWREFTGTNIKVPQYKVTGQNLLKNPALKSDGKSLFPKDWTVSTPKREPSELINRNKDDFMVIGSAEKSFTFTLSQIHKLQVGKRYRFSAEIQADAPVMLLVRDGKDDSVALLQEGENTLAVEFTPVNNIIRLTVHGSNFAINKQATIKQLELHELTAE